jgi:hypothetical protein
MSLDAGRHGTQSWVRKQSGLYPYIVDTQTRIGFHRDGGRFVPTELQIDSRANRSKLNLLWHAQNQRADTSTSHRL